MSAIQIKVYRHDPQSDPNQHWDTFRVEAGADPSVLDLLFEVVKSHDQSLSFRCSCRIGMCGSCAMIINGRERLACRTKVRALGARVTVKPLNHMPVVKDLTVDMEPFFQKYEQVIPYYVGDSQDFAMVPDGAPARAYIDANLDCITCGACYSACSMLAFDEDYLGPAALNRAYCLMADDRDQAYAERWQVVDNEHGIWRCHTHFDCMKVCPKGIVPTLSIQQMKNEAVLAQLGGSRGSGDPPPELYEPPVDPETGDPIVAHPTTMPEVPLPVPRSAAIASTAPAMVAEVAATTPAAVAEAAATADVVAGEPITRKSFLGTLVTALGGLAGLLLLIPGLSNLRPPVTQAGGNRWVSLGAVDDFAVDEVQSVPFTHTEPSGATIRQTAYVMRKSATGFVVYDFACTHLGCPIRWVDSARMFVCPCHGGAFNEEGEVLSGPPPKPLNRYEYKAENGQLLIQDLSQL